MSEPSIAAVGGARNVNVTNRETSTSVVFRHPFTLAGVKEENPAGTYVVETIEEKIDGLSFAAYRRVSTTIVLPSGQFGQSSRQVFTIEPQDLEAALARDRAKP